MFGFVAFVLLLIMLEGLNLSLALKRRRSHREAERDEREAQESRVFDSNAHAD